MQILNPKLSEVYKEKNLNPFLFIRGQTNNQLNFAVEF